MQIELLQSFISWIARLVCGVSIFTRGVDLTNVGRALFFANHSSHFDFIAIWSALPKEARTHVRPVAARDYWGNTGIRHFLSQRVFNSILIDRNSKSLDDDPLKEVKAALVAGDSVIIFPEGTRSLDGTIKDFKSGLFYISKEFPELPIVPVFLDNLNRILPKGEFIVVPLLSRVIFGPPLFYSADENKGEFLDRAKAALEALA